MKTAGDSIFRPQKKSPKRDFFCGLTAHIKNVS